MAKSVLYSCAHGQNPLWTRIGIFVDINAVIIMIISGMDAILVRNPKMTSVPQIISKVPVKYAQNAGLLKPIVVNLPVPRSSGKMNFCIPSVRKINPTVNLMTIVPLLASLSKITLFDPFFVFMAEIN